MTFFVETRLKRGNEFIPIKEWRGDIIDPLYIEGAVVMSYQGRMLMGEDLWDDVNYLWPYFFNGLIEISNGKDWDTRFPDQPITFSIKHVTPDWLMLHIYADDEEYAKKKIPKSEYMKGMVDGGRDFLSLLYRICPDADLPFEHYFRVLGQLQTN